MVDDSTADRTLCRLLLREEYGAELDFAEAPTARRGLELCRTLAARPLPDCVLLDYKLPDMTGAEFLRHLRDSEAQSAEGAHSGALPKTDPIEGPALHKRQALHKKIDLPKFAVVMLTGLGNEQVAAEAIRAGAQDYLVKDGITAKSLRLAIEKATGKVGLLKDLQDERDRLARLLSDKEALLSEKEALLFEKDALLSEKEALLTEKDALLEEVHHRVKNNLQVIASLLRLQAENFGDAKLAAALQESQNRVESMALIHEQLYQARNLREVDLAENAALLANHLMHAYGIDPARVQCTVNVEKLAVGVDRAIPAALILNELISNALKHAFPEGRAGRIEVKGRRSKGMIGLEVRDNGVGVGRAAGSEQSRTLGLNIVRILTHQLGGAFAIECNGDGQKAVGAICRLTFPEEGEKHAREQNADGKIASAGNSGGKSGGKSDEVLQRAAG
jgi:two-component sensor histidine kinase